MKKVKKKKNNYKFQRIKFREMKKISSKIKLISQLNVIQGNKLMIMNNIIIHKKKRISLWKKVTKNKNKFLRQLKIKFL